MSLDEFIEGAEVISAYTRQQAIADGVLVEVTEPAKEAGFRFHTVVTRNVWDRCVQVPEGSRLQSRGQDQQGRLWDVLWMASLAARRAPGESLVTFTVSVMAGQRVDGSPYWDEHQLWLHIGPGDSGEPVLTIMFPEDY
jgi:hypothetical protein